MKNSIIQSEIDVRGSKINVVRVDGYELYIINRFSKNAK